MRQLGALVEDISRLVNGAPHTWAEKIYFGLKILMKPSHDCSYSPMGGRSSGALLEKTEEPSRGNSDNGATTAPWQPL